MLRSRRCRLQLLRATAIISSLLLIAFLVYDPGPAWVKAAFPVGRNNSLLSPFITTFPSTNHSLGKVKFKTVLLWTDFFGSKNWLAPSDVFKSCAVGLCRLTWDGQEVGDADAVVVNVRAISSGGDLPPSHPPHQVWILHGSEPPYYVYARLGGLGGLFNWTSWYRSDADIYSPYGAVQLISTTSRPQNVSLPSYPDSARPTQEPFNAFPPEAKVEWLQPMSLNPDPWSLHDRLVFWMASSCINPGQRFRRLSQLRAHLDVDTYGNCGDLTCPIGSRKCEDTLKRYKFVLSLENGYCRDYITEKYWNAIARQQIPVVSGGADYARLALPGSYIDVNDFATTAQLAAYLLKVAADRQLYNSFFAWRHRYRAAKGGVVNWCQLCAALHDKSRPPQVYTDVRGWVAQDSCPMHSYFDIVVWKKQYVTNALFGI